MYSFNDARSSARLSRQRPDEGAKPSTARIPPARKHWAVAHCNLLCDPCYIGRDGRHARNGGISRVDRHLTGQMVTSVGDARRKCQHTGRRRSVWRRMAAVAERCGLWPTAHRGRPCHSFPILGGRRLGEWRGMVVQAGRRTANPRGATERAGESRRRSETHLWERGEGVRAARTPCEVPSVAGAARSARFLDF